MKKYFFSQLLAKLMAWSMVWLCIGSMNAFSEVEKSQEFGERILSFNSEITINKDASMVVTERLSVVANGNKIRRGIYREFPIRYRDKLGNNVLVEFDVLSIKRDGNPETYRIEKGFDSITIYLGKSDHFLDPGEYHYQITYKTDRQIAYFDDFDELYWNITGNDWDFAIQKASATITLPAAVAEDKLKIYGYTGYRGSDEDNYRHTVLNDQQVYFETTDMLKAEQGLTVKLQFPKGLIYQPGRLKKLQYFVQDNIQALISVIGMLGVLFYYLVVWWRVGKDPVRDVIIPRYEAPENLSAAAVRFISRVRCDNKTFTTAILSLAVKGYVKIEEDERGYRLVKINSADKALLEDEQAVLDQLIFSEVDGQQIFELNSKNRQYLQESTGALVDYLKSNYQEKCFLDNKQFLIRGVVASLIVVVVSALFGTFDQFGILLFCLIWFGASILLLFVGYADWKAVVTAKKHRISALIMAVFKSFFIAPFVIVGLIMLLALAAMCSPLMAVGIVGMYIINIRFHYLLKAPTVFGSQLLDQIEGFKMYLGTAEGDRISSIKEPHKTPELFESLLPFAFALDLENAWAEKFSDVLSRVRNDATSYQPRWYSGKSWSSASAAGFTSSLSDSFSSTVAASSRSPRSSSSSSSGRSGGSSGGGRGGGGGGGW